jgi:hypothetical protein
MTRNHFFSTFPTFHQGAAGIIEVYAVAGICTIELSLPNF